MDRWNGLKEYAIPSETVRRYLEKIGWEPTPRQLASIFCSRKLPPAEHTDFFSHLNTIGDETLSAQIRTLLKRPADLDEDPAHFIHDPPVSETVSFPFHVGDIVWCLGWEDKPALYLGQEFGLVISADKDRHDASWTTFPGQDGERLGVEFLDEQGNFTPGGRPPWELERAAPWDGEKRIWRCLKQGRDLLLGRGSFCAFLSAREAFCREFPEIRAKRHGEIDATLRQTVESLERGEMEFMTAEAFFAELRKKLGMTEKKQAQGQRGALDEQG